MVLKADMLGKSLRAVKVVWVTLGAVGMDDSTTLLN
jgi:hypothetical protein